MIASSDSLSDPENPAGYEVVIEAGRNGLRVDWRELWEYRDLLYLLVRRDFVAKYKQTVLGPAWVVLQPLMMTLVFTVLFGHVVQIPTDGIPRPLFYFCGFAAWNYFAQNLGAASTTFTASAYLFEKVYFPRLIIPLSAVISNLLAFALTLATFFGFFLYFKLFTEAGSAVAIGWSALLLPVLVVYTAALSLGVALWMSSLTAKYRDLAHVMSFLTQVWLYATPVIYPLSEVHGRLRWIAEANPMTAVVESFRYCLLGTSSLTADTLIISLTLTGLLLLTGARMFRATERTFVDTV
jgi:lipopolysaccharide transport system permease protein